MRYICRRSLRAWVGRQACMHACIQKAREVSCYMRDVFSPAREVFFLGMPLKLQMKRLGRSWRHRWEDIPSPSLFLSPCPCPSLPYPNSYIFLILIPILIPIPIPLPRSAV